jgi:hypothetical protein
VLGQPAARHTSADFVTFLTQVVASQPAGRHIHVILDNISTHKAKLVQARSNATSWRGASSRR